MRNLLPCQMKPTSRGFTLIELLVVIAIIAILAAILFPVFAQARERARMSACLSHGKQLATATMMYIDDNKGRCPTQLPAELIGRPLGTFQGKTFGAQLWSYRIHPGFTPFVRDDKIWICPTRGGNGFYGKRYAFGYLQTWIPFAHVSLPGTDGGWYNAVTKTPYTLAELDGKDGRSLSQRVGWFCMVLNMPDSFMPGMQLPFMPHKDGSIYLYMDGHATFKKTAENSVAPIDYYTGL